MEAIGWIIVIAFFFSTCTCCGLVCSKLSWDLNNLLDWNQVAGSWSITTDGFGRKYVQTSSTNARLISNISLTENCGGISGSILTPAGSGALIIFGYTNSSNYSAIVLDTEGFHCYGITAGVITEMHAAPGETGNGTGVGSTGNFTNVSGKSGTREYIFKLCFSPTEVRLYVKHSTDGLSPYTEIDLIWKNCRSVTQGNFGFGTNNVSTAVTKFSWSGGAITGSADCNGKYLVWEPPQSSTGSCYCACCQLLYQDCLESIPTTLEVTFPTNDSAPFHPTTNGSGEYNVQLPPNIAGQTFVLSLQECGDSEVSEYCDSHDPPGVGGTAGNYYALTAHHTFGSGIYRYDLGVSTQPNNIVGGNESFEHTIHAQLLPAGGGGCPHTTNTLVITLVTRQVSTGCRSAIRWVSGNLTNCLGTVAASLEGWSNCQDDCYTSIGFQADYGSGLVANNTGGFGVGSFNRWDLSVIV